MSQARLDKADIEVKLDEAVAHAAVEAEANELKLNAAMEHAKVGRAWWACWLHGGQTMCTWFSI